MRILLDECIDERFRHGFSAFDCQTARYAGFAGLTNGALLSAAETAGFDVLITVDQNLIHQQNLENRAVAIVIVRVPTNRLIHMAECLPAILEALSTIGPGAVITVP